VFSILYSVQITLNNRYWDTSDECRRSRQFLNAFPREIGDGDASS